MDYERQSNKARLKVIEMLYTKSKSHIGSNMSVIDLLTVLFDKANLDEDRIIMSKGWAAASMLYFLSEYGFFPKEDLERFCNDDEKKYIGLLEPSVNGVHMASGSVGMGTSFGVGMAKAKKLSGEGGRVYVIEGEGGMQCGLTWEALQIASQHELDNFVLIVDRNGLQAMGEPKEILDLSNLKARVETFGCSCVEIDGHEHRQIENCLNSLDGLKPKVIIIDTIKGKGVPEVENEVSSHYVPPTKEQYERAKIDLK